MDLHHYLALPDALSIRDFADCLDGAPSDSLIRLVRQWSLWYAEGRPARNPRVRQPSARRCVEFIRIDKRMTLQALRPDDWFAIWPQLPGAAKALAAARDAQPVHG